MFKRVINEETKLPADIKYLSEMRDFVTRIGRKYGVGERNINAFKLAIDEAATNIIRHAYRDWDGFIILRMIIRNRTVTVSMIDQGHAFDPRSVKDPDLGRYVEIGKKGGLGIFIIRRVIDDIDYRKTTEGNELRLTKNREIMPKRQVSLPSLGSAFSMKARFSVISCVVLTCLALFFGTWSYLRQGTEVRQDYFAEGRRLANVMARNAVDHLGRITGPDTPELTVLASGIQRDNAPLVLEALVVDTSGILAGASGAYIPLQSFILESFELPRYTRQIENDVFQFKLMGGKVVYDFVKDVIPEGNLVSIGSVHVMFDKEVIQADIRDARERTVLFYGLLLLGSFIGIFLLIYITLSPFKRLVQWIRALGRDEVQDDMEFDASTEVGEIAQAFSEITEKFRKSQANLAEQERLQKEMQVAQEIQHTLLPAKFPKIEGYEIASYYEAAKEVGGDYFDFVEVDKETLGIVVADVSGKGVPGSLVMTMIRTALRTEARLSKNPADVLAKVNDFVMNDMKRGMFVTIFYIVLDSHKRTISYASAGHNPMILYRSKTEKSFYLNPRGFPIGINLPDKELFRKSIQSETLQLKEGDVLIAYTDGVTEAMNPDREQFGEERFLSVIRKYGSMSVEPLVDKIRDNINAFIEGFTQNDDITLVAIQEKMRAEDVLYNLRSRLLDLVNKEGMSVKKACETVGVSTSTYYKYKKRFEKEGTKGLREKTIRSEIEDKHISIEDKAKIYDIIKQNPDFGPKRISEELNTAMYGFTDIDDKRIYEELVKNRLNNRELRMAFIERGGKRKRMKPPGTPLLTLDGQVIIEKKRKSPHIQPPSVSQEEEASGQEPAKLPSLEQIIPEKGTHPSSVDDSFELDTEKFPEIEGETGMHKIDEDISLAADEADVSGEAGTDSSWMEGVSSEESADAEELFDDLVVDLVDVSDDDVHDEESPSIEDIITRGEDGSENLGIHDEIESQISSSIAGELLAQEMEVSEEDEEEEEVLFEPDDDEDEDFLRAMGSMGFDQGQIFDTDRTLLVDEPTSEEKARMIKKDLESGLWYYRHGQYDNAIEKFKDVLRTAPETSEAYQYLGDTFFRTGELKRAKEAYEKVREMDPDNLSVMENLGVIFANRGDYKKAVWQWGEVLKRNPDRRDIIDRIKKMQRVIRQRSM